MNTILLIYILGVIAALILCVLELRKQAEIVVADLISVTIFSSLSWIAVIWGTFDLYGDVVIYRKHDKGHK